MNPEVRVILACSGISLILTYFWWVRVRVWIFRQDLFQLRDELWDAMRAEGMLDDPDYRNFREGINALVRLAPLLSILTVLDLVLNRGEFRAPSLDHPRLASLVKARSAVFRRVTRYLLLETISGLAIMALLIAFGLGMAFYKAVGKRIEWLIDSHEVQGLDSRLSSASGRHLLEV